jgi:hypothetical protein
MSCYRTKLGSFGGNRVNVIKVAMNYRVQIWEDSLESAVKSKGNEGLQWWRRNLAFKIFSVI